MAEINFINSGKKITTNDVENVERGFNIQLPKEYKDFLLRTNGGRPDKLFFSKDSSDYVLNEFFPLSNSPFSFEQYFSDFRVDQNILSKSLAPIAEDAFGNLICISIGKNDYGYIYFLDHESSNREDINGTSTRLIATDFNSFLDMLKNDND